MPTFRNLDQPPRIFFLPGDQAFPWVIIAFISYLIVRLIAMFLGVEASWWSVSLVSLWGIITWWILTRRGLHVFFSRFLKTPHWSRAIIPYQPIFNYGSNQKSWGKKPQKSRLGRI